MILNSYMFGPSYDPDAQAFITAAAISDTSQQVAINNLVLSLKSYGVWSKMKAIYPMVGGSAASHKWNLKDPQDTNAAFRLVFSGGWTHSATGAKPNGANAYADTFLTPSTSILQNSSHISYYSRTQSIGTEIEIGSATGLNAGDAGTLIEVRTSGTTYYRVSSGTNYISFNDSDSRAFYIANRTASNVVNGWRNSTKAITGATASTGLSTRTFWLGALNSQTLGQFYSIKECAFASIGDGLTDAEAANFYTAVQAYQTTLGRSVGPQTVSDPDAQAFVTAASIVEQVQANAVNQLVIDMKAANIWTKMKAVYPFVGGTATTHKWNLKNPLDTNAAFRLTFAGGWTHSSTGALANGANGYADTFATKTVFTNNNLGCQGAFMTAVTGSTIRFDFGIATAGGFFALRSHNLVGNNTFYNGNTNAKASSAIMQNLGFIASSRIANNDYKTIIQDGSVVLSTTNDTTAYHTGSFYIGNSNQLNSGYSNREFRFYFLSDPLSSSELTSLRTATITFQTTLGRNV